eukprot:gene11876-11967_t
MSEDTTKIVNPKQLVALIKDSDQKKTRMQSISGEIGQRVKEATENGHLHRGAFALMVRLYRMDELKREDFIRQFDLYVDMCRENELFGTEHTGDLVDMAANANDSEQENDPDAEAAERNEALLRGGISELKEPDEEPHLRVTKTIGDAPGTYKVN